MHIGRLLCDYFVFTNRIRHTMCAVVTEVQTCALPICFNAVVRKEGEPPRFDFEPRDHVALLEMNDWADLGRITQVSSSRQYCLKGRLALLEQALMFWAQQTLAGEGFTMMTVPEIGRATCRERECQ